MSPIWNILFVVLDLFVYIYAFIYIYIFTYFCTDLLFEHVAFHKHIEKNGMAIDGFFLEINLRKEKWIRG